MTADIFLSFGEILFEIVHRGYEVRIKSKRLRTFTFWTISIINEDLSEVYTVTHHDRSYLYKQLSEFLNIEGDLNA
jgi:hypothetical protein